MPVTSDIVATYRGPGKVVRRLLSYGAHEGRALAIAMAGCAVLFIARLPALSRQAHIEGAELNMLLGGSLLSVVFILPLILYLVAFVVQQGARLMGSKITGYGSRIALFWSLLAASPFALLNGLVAGFIGEGPALTIVGAIWLALFVWFWGASLRAAGAVGQEAQV